MRQLLKGFPRGITRKALDHGNNSKRGHKFRHQEWVADSRHPTCRSSVPVREGRFKKAHWHRRMDWFFAL